MKIEEGKYYRTRDGRKAGPTGKFEDGGPYKFFAFVPSFGEATFTDTGDWQHGSDDGMDLVSEWIEPGPITAQPGTWSAEPGYEQLAAILQEAHDQAATGKGKERHANARPFHDQPIIHIGRQHGVGFNTGQATKKTEEAIGMLSRGDPDAAARELIGAIVYLASAVLLIREPRP